MIDGFQSQAKRTCPLLRLEEEAYLVPEVRAELEVTEKAERSARMLTCQYPVARSRMRKAVDLGWRISEVYEPPIGWYCQ